MIYKLKLKYILYILIILFGLYIIINNCNCNKINLCNNGFSIGADTIIDHSNIEFFIFSEDMHIPASQVAARYLHGGSAKMDFITDLKNYAGLKESIEKLFLKNFGSSDIYDGYYIVGLYENPSGPITILDSKYFLLYANLILINFKNNLLDKDEILKMHPDKELIPNDYIKDITDGGWPPLILPNYDTLINIWTDKYGGAYVKQFREVYDIYKSQGASKKELLNYLIETLDAQEDRKKVFKPKYLKNFMVNVCKECEGHIANKGIFKYIMDNFKTENFFKNGNKENINVDDIFESDGDHLNIYLSPGSNTLLNEWKINKKDEKDEFDDCKEIFMNKNDVVNRFKNDTQRLYDYYIRIGFEDTNELAFMCENWTGTNKKYKELYEDKENKIIFTISLLKYTF